jgi:hypothetical protein
VYQLFILKYKRKIKKIGRAQTGRLTVVSTTLLMSRQGHFFICIAQKCWSAAGAYRHFMYVSYFRNVIVTFLSPKCHLSAQSLEARMWQEAGRPSQHFIFPME